MVKEYTLTDAYVRMSLICYKIAMLSTLHLFVTRMLSKKISSRKLILI